MGVFEVASTTCPVTIPLISATSAETTVLKKKTANAIVSRVFKRFAFIIILFFELRFRK
jgi:hypothetical protein